MNGRKHHWCATYKHTCNEKTCKLEIRVLFSYVCSYRCFECNIFIRNWNGLHILYISFLLILITRLMLPLRSFFYGIGSSRSLSCNVRHHCCDFIHIFIFIQRDWKADRTHRVSVIQLLSHSLSTTVAHSSSTQTDKCRERIANTFNWTQKQTFSIILTPSKYISM